MPPIISVPGRAGHFDYQMRAPAELVNKADRPTSRSTYAACHVVARAYEASAASPAGTIDWRRTLEERIRVWELGLGVAEAMDTAQRGAGLHWGDAQHLIAETLQAGEDLGGATVVGISTDNLDAGGKFSLGEIADAYIAQMQFVQSRGGTVVAMASRHLAAAAKSPEDYLFVYSRVLDAADSPIILHWLGSMFDSHLADYWTGPGATLDLALDTVQVLLDRHARVIEGIKVSLLDPRWERSLWRRVPHGMKVYTGDDFNYVDMIAGDGDGNYSHALLGAFAAVAPIARMAMKRLDDGDVDGFRTALEPTIPLSRLLFEAPTAYYKAGIVWLSYLQGYQPHFRMLGGFESGRSIRHLVEVFLEADALGLFRDPDQAAHRLDTYLDVHGLSRSRRSSHV